MVQYLYCTTDESFARAQCSYLILTFIFNAFEQTWYIIRCFSIIILINCVRMSDYARNEMKRIQCVCCSSRTIEIQQFNSLTNCRNFQKTYCGLQCKICHCLICDNCIMQLSIKIKQIRNDIHHDFL